MDTKSQRQSRSRPRGIQSELWILSLWERTLFRLVQQCLVDLFDPIHLGFQVRLFDLVAPGTHLDLVVPLHLGHPGAHVGHIDQGCSHNLKWSQVFIKKISNVHMVSRAHCNRNSDIETLQIIIKRSTFTCNNKLSHRL